MIIDKAKQSFQEWANTHYLLSELSWTIEEGEYSEPEMQYAWEAWQASRESLVIELPANRITQDSIMMRLHCRQAIEAAGLKVAP